MQGDHTYEVEQRVRAIHVTSEDTCGFFSQKRSFVAGRRCCLYCAYGDFGRASTNDDTDSALAGLCKYRLHEHKTTIINNDTDGGANGGVAKNGESQEA